jgi:hypothetical protein
VGKQANPEEALTQITAKIQRKQNDIHRRNCLDGTVPAFRKIIESLDN